MSVASAVETEEKYSVTNPLEVLAILRGLQKQKALVAAYVEPPQEFIITSVLGIDSASREVMFGAASTAELNDQLLRAQNILCVSSHNGVKVTFTIEGLDRTLYEGEEALIGNVPARMRRLERRDYYRLPGPSANPLKCVIPVMSGAQRGSAELTVLDLSVGGVGVMNHHHLVDLKAGNRYRGCQLSLPGVSTVVFDLEVVLLMDVTLPNGLSCQRAGCRFRNLAPTIERDIQRYIMQLQRERSARGVH